MKRILHITLFILGAAVLLSTAISVNSSRAADNNKIAIAYSGMVMGYMEPCG
ncbi:MAG: hypothetical protein QUT30_03850 [Acidobacteriota bacterium]|jgi:hypothetical protein|nr:hypothetical protein [Acidobacteriota bacterium]